MFSFFVLVDHLGDVGKGRYGIADLLEFVVLTLPRRAYEIFPMSALIGSLLGLGVLAGNSELTVVRTAGVSLARIVLAVMKGGVVLMLAAVILGEGVAPYSESLAQTRRQQALSGNAAAVFGSSLWARDGSSFINIGRVGEGGNMAGVYIYEFDGAHRLRVATHARQARYAEGRWLLDGIAQSRLGDAGVTTQRIERAEWNSAFGPDLINVAVDEPERRSAWGLFKYVRYLRANGLESAPHELGLWTKLVTPLSTAVMIFLAVPFVFGPLRSVTVGQRILVGVLVGIAFQLANQTFVKLGLVYGLSPFLSAVLPTAVFFLLAVVMVRRTR
jgi:lipopolysaccharide export system permease protein